MGSLVKPLFYRFGLYESDIHVSGDCAGTGPDVPQVGVCSLFYGASDDPACRDGVGVTRRTRRLYTLSGASLVAFFSLGIRPLLLATHLQQQIAVKSFRVQLCDALMLLVAILAIGLGILSFGWLGLDASHKIIVWVSAGLSYSSFLPWWAG